LIELLLLPLFQHWFFAYSKSDNHNVSFFTGWPSEENGQVEEFDRRSQFGRRQGEGEERQSFAHDFPAKHSQTALAR